MAVSVDAFAHYVGEDYENSDRQVDLNRSLSVALTLIEAELHGINPEYTEGIPSNLKDQWVLDVAYAVYKRSENNNGQYETPDTLRAPNDPLQQVRAMLSRYVVYSL